MISSYSNVKLLIINKSN